MIGSGMELLPMLASPSSPSSPATSSPPSSPPVIFPSSLLQSTVQPFRAMHAMPSMPMSVFLSLPSMKPFVPPPSFSLLPPNFSAMYRKRAACHESESVPPCPKRSRIRSTEPTSMKEIPYCALAMLPTELQLSIFSFCHPFYDLLSIERTCRWISQLIYTADLWLAAFCIDTQSFYGLRSKLHEPSLLRLLTRIRIENSSEKYLTKIMDKSQHHLIGLQGKGIVRLNATTPNPATTGISPSNAFPPLTWASLVSFLQLNVRELCLDGLITVPLPLPVFPSIMLPSTIYASLNVLSLRASPSLTDTVVGSLLAATPNITSLDLTGCPLLSDHLLRALPKLLPLLLKLSIGSDIEEEEASSSITDKGLADLTRGCHRLRSLTLIHCTSLTPRLRHIISVQAPQLERLSIKSCRLYRTNDELSNCELESLYRREHHKKKPCFTLEIENGVIEMPVFLDFLASFPDVTHVTLFPSYCPEYEESIEQRVHKSVKSNVIALWMNADYFTNDDCRDAFFSYFPMLQYFSIGSEYLDAEEEEDCTPLIFALSRRCPSLKFVTTTNIPIRSGIIDALATGCPLLETLQISESPAFGTVSKSKSTESTGLWKHLVSTAPNSRSSTPRASQRNIGTAATIPHPKLMNLHYIDIWPGTPISDADVINLISRIPNVRHISFWPPEEGNNNANELSDDIELESTQPCPLITIRSMTLTLALLPALESIKFFGHSSLSATQLKILSLWHLYKPCMFSLAELPEKVAKCFDDFVQLAGIISRQETGKINSYELCGLWLYSTAPVDDLFHLLHRKYPLTNSKRIFH